MILVQLPDNLYRCPKPWINFIEHCQDTAPKDQNIEEYVDCILMDKYDCVIDDAAECVIFNDRDLYTLFMLDWS